MNRKNRILIVKKVWQNKKSDFNLNESDVYLTKRNNLTRKVKEIETKGNSFVKSKLMLTFSIKNKFPILKGRLTLANRKEILSEVRGNAPFEKPLKKAISADTIKKQLSKTDNYPYEITQINVNYDGTLFIPISKINELRRNLFKTLENEVNALYIHKSKKIKLENSTNINTANEANISFYTNNLNHLKNINGVKRVYLEIPNDDDTLDMVFNGNYNLNHMITFLKEAYEISYGKDWELIWKWPDIAHDKLIKALNKARGILSKMHYDIPIMSNAFNGEYGPYSMNITNTETIDSLEYYKVLTISPELSKKDYEDIAASCKDSNRIELLVQGSVELMKSRYHLLHGNELERNYKNYLVDRKNNRYPIHKSISGEEITIFNDSELSLLEEINHLKNLGYCNFSIDGRYKDDDYYKMIDVYKSALNGNINKKELLKYSPKNTLGNY